ncbi:MAG: hypothetical protein LJU34_01295 [Oscillospiraceae bacterium]|nr:hypothetical protein [Oscillospiraceae bacterium]
MKHIPKAARPALVLALALAMTFALGLAAYAEADAASLDFEKTGSVSLTLADSSGNTVTDGAVTICQVATLYLDDGSMAYAYTEAFANCGETLDVTDAALASALADYAEDNQITGTTASVGADGTVRFDGLTLGLYLVTQTTQSTGYNAISPFLVTVPFAGSDAWIYDVDASPKVEVYTAATIPPESVSPTPTTTTTTTTTLPQTGQLNWPVPVLAASGIVLFAIGWAMVVTDRKKRGNAA